MSNEELYQEDFRDLISIFDTTCQQVRQRLLEKFFAGYVGWNFQSFETSFKTRVKQNLEDEDYIDVIALCVMLKHLKETKDA